MGTRARARPTMTIPGSGPPPIPIPATPTSPRSSRRGIWPTVTRQLHPQWSTIEHGSVHAIHGIFCVAALIEPHERKTSAFFSPIITRDVNIAYVSILLEDLAQRFWGGPIRQVIHLQGGHSPDVRRRSSEFAHDSRVGMGRPGTFRTRLRSFFPKKNF